MANKDFVLNRIKKLYEDWLSSKSKKELYEAKSILKLDTKIKNRVYTKLVEMMGLDGQNLSEILENNWSVLADTKADAKKIVIEYLSEDKNGSVVTDIGLSYYPISDRSNAMQSEAEFNDRDLLVQIRNAITGGNLMIASELLKNGWGKLSLKERNSLIEWVNNIGKYQKYNPNVPRSTGKTVLKPLEKLSSMKKEDYISNLLTTAKENMKIY